MVRNLEPGRCSDGPVPCSSTNRSPLPLGPAAQPPEEYAACQRSRHSRLDSDCCLTFLDDTETTTNLTAGGRLGHVSSMPIPVFLTTVRDSSIRAVDDKSTGHSSAACISADPAAPRPHPMVQSGSSLGRRSHKPEAFSCSISRIYQRGRRSPISRSMCGRCPHPFY